MIARHDRARFALAASALAVLILAPAAQAQVTPMSVNDCTLLPDPGALRRCLDQAEGRVVTTPPPLNTTTGLSQPTQSTQDAPATRPAANPNPPNPMDFNFFTGLANRPVEARPSRKNVIDLD